MDMEPTDHRGTPLGSHVNNHSNKVAALRKHLNSTKGYTLTLAEYRAMNPEGAPLTGENDGPMTMSRAPLTGKEYTERTVRRILDDPEAGNY